jgi:hypothetical protein
MIKHLCKIVSPGAVYFDSQAMQEHTCCRRSVVIAALLYLLIYSSGASVDTGGREHLLRNRIRHYHIIEGVVSPRIENHQIHALVVRWIDVVKNA